MSFETRSVASTTPRSRFAWTLAIALGLVAAGSSILLTGIAVWFLSAVALAGTGIGALTFNFHIPAALVRLLALSRTCAKYGERLVGHKAALLDQMARRTRLFTAMASAPSVLQSSWQLGNQDRLADYMDDVEDADFAKLRVALPLAALIGGLAGLIASTAWFAPMALIPVLSIAALLAMGAATTHRIAAESYGAERSAQNRAGRLLGQGLWSVVGLKAERKFDLVAGEALREFGLSGDERLKARLGLAVLDTFAALAGPLAALSVMLAAWGTGGRGTALLAPALIAFAFLALGDQASGLSRAVAGRARARAASKRLDLWTTSAARASEVAFEMSSATAARFDKLVPYAPGGRPIAASLDLDLRAGQPVAIVGPSGAGKTTVLKIVAGWLDAPVVCSLGQADARRPLVHFALHDAAVLSGSVRENLFAPAATAERCWSALDAVELGGRIRSAGGLEGWLRQDMLSLGEAQRLALARALLSCQPIVLFDEPTEHLDKDQAMRILPRLLARLDDRIVVYATHDPRAAALAQHTIALQPIA